MSTVHGKVFTLLQRWRDEIDSDPLSVPIDLPALQARRDRDQARYPSAAHAVCRIRDTALRAQAVQPPADSAGAQRPLAHPPAWIPDELYPYPAAG